MRRFVTTSLVALLAVGWATPGMADLVVERGATKIERGEALGRKDITVDNGIFAVAFAVQTAPPWGVARGGIIDIAFHYEDGLGYDIASLADFMPNNWSAWPTTRQRVKVDKKSRDEVVVRTERDWGEVELVTTFTIRDMDPVIHVITTMNNEGEQDLEDILSGYVVWPDGGFLFGVPGLSGETTADETSALADWSASYDHNWVLGTHAPFATLVSYGGRDRYASHTLAAGGTATFETWLELRPEGSLAHLTATEIDRDQKGSGRLTGSVDAPDAVVVVYKDGHVFTWAQVEDNRFDIRLPVGDYEYQALAMGYGPSERRSHTVANAETIDVRIDDLKEPASIEFAVRDKASGDPLDARIEVSEGYRPVVGFLGRPTFFTDFVDQGRVATTIAPGYYRFSVSSGAGFTASTVMLETELGPGAEASLLAEIPVEAVPSQRGWYSADLHHHSDVLDGFSDPDEVAISVLASGTDVLFLSDHDSMINNAELGRLSALRGRTFIPATELSPSYAHFNAYPIDDDSEIEIDVGASTVQEVFEEARRIGADVIQANHPWGDYGYFTALELEAALGGYDDGFDVVEITAGDNAKTMQRVWQMWNAGSTKYLAAGSDVHDVYAEISGAARSFVHINGEPTVDAFVSNLLAGHSYASQGPLIFPEIMFGSTIDQQPEAELVLEYEVQSVSGLRHIMLIESGEEVDRRIVDGNGPVNVRFVVTPAANTWYALVVEDEADKFAYSNPVWVNMRENER